MKTFAMFLTLSFFAVISTDVVSAGEDHDDAHDYRSKFYGTIEEMPAGTPGTWVVDGRTVTVSPKTHIEQEHGRAAVGAFVEIKGKYNGHDFRADEIEVKQGVRSQNSR